MSRIKEKMAYSNNAEVAVSGCQQVNVCGNTLSNGMEGVYFVSPSSNSVILANNFGGVAHNSIVDLGWESGTVQDAQVIGNMLGRGDSYHLKTPYTQGPNWFLYKNQYVDSHSNSVPVFTDSASLPAHITY